VDGHSAGLAQVICSMVGLLIHHGRMGMVQKSMSMRPALRNECECWFSSEGSGTWTQLPHAGV